ncbi:divalent-cation tolerance protein CutA [Cyanobium sp. Alchichica 3B3-8F6]|jgi:periplasmic divalent cation tolerance protein|uniref:divalent-cation tolerance protein CutA n=1 Tax=Synechococcales TaxID=1890424 RepID=UPI000B99AAC6|nr:MULTISPECIES: divalent-cation tolerance protein CutA [Synechococcales]MCP9881913.1 divalent-cation tolerance protein CutA [Cyanobium sp. Alchichica 3B3-8F6]MCP9891826.1 divalent-cation tolerance protein CutA [Cyanobium sp. Aljojuca 7D2]
MTDANTNQPLQLVLTTEASPERARALAAELLERRLVACASLLPVQSHYRWQGQITSSEEVQLLLKTSPERLEALREALLALHSYDTPEWIHWSAVSAGAYGQWLVESLSPDAGPPGP